MHSLAGQTGNTLVFVRIGALVFSPALDMSTKQTAPSLEV